MLEQGAHRAHLGVTRGAVTAAAVDLLEYRGGGFDAEPGAAHTGTGDGR
jgi:hypothetical protein